MKECVIIINEQTIAGYVVAWEQFPGSSEKRYIVSNDKGELFSVAKEFVKFN